MQNLSNSTHLSRRSFLRGAAALSGAALVGPVGCSGVQRRDFSASAQKNVDGLKPDEQEILRLASLASSGHNAQPWRVKILGGGRFELRLDRSRLLPAVDPDGRETMLSMANFLENLSEGARARGYAYGFRQRARTNTDELVGEFRLEALGTPADAETQKQLETRRVIKNAHLGTDLSVQTVRELTLGDTSYFSFFPASSPEGRKITEATLEANQAQVDRRAAQEELAEWIRWSNSAAREHRDGLTPASMEITGFSGFYVRMFYGPEDVLTPGFAQQTMERVRAWLDGFGGWLVLRTRDSSARSLLQGGRYYQAMFNRARSQNLAIQPMSQALEESPFLEQLGPSIGINEPIQYLIRVSEAADYAAPVSLRRPVAWFVES